MANDNAKLTPDDWDEIAKAVEEDRLMYTPPTWTTEPLPMVGDRIGVVRRDSEGRVYAELDDCCHWCLLPEVPERPTLHGVPIVTRPNMGGDDDEVIMVPEKPE